MADEVREPIEGDGYAVANIEALGDHYGFRKIRARLGVTAFGINAICMPPAYEGPRHSHEQQQEIYFVHSGTMRMDFGDGTSQVLGPGGIARVDAATVRQIVNVSQDEDLIYVSAGGKDGYVGRDGVPGGETSSSG
jgi:mannose-6-phosphate isomerase-like protein (cupin superfamily)